MNETLLVISNDPPQMGSQNASDGGTWVQVRRRNVRSKQKVPNSSASTEEPSNVVGTSISVNSLDEDLCSPNKSCSDDSISGSDHDLSIQSQGNKVVPETQPGIEQSPGLDHSMALRRNEEMEKQAKKVRAGKKRSQKGV